MYDIPVLKEVLTHWSEPHGEGGSTDSRKSPTTLLLYLIWSWQVILLQFYIDLAHLLPVSSLPNVLRERYMCSLQHLCLRSGQSESPPPSIGFMSAMKPRAKYLAFCSSWRMAKSWANLLTLKRTAGFHIFMTWLHVTWIPSDCGLWIPLPGPHYSASFINHDADCSMAYGHRALDQGPLCVTPCVSASLEKLFKPARLVYAHSLVGWQTLKISLRNHRHRPEIHRATRYLTQSTESWVQICRWFWGEF